MGWQIIILIGLICGIVANTWTYYKKETNLLFFLITFIGTALAVIALILFFLDIIHSIAYFVLVAVALLLVIVGWIYLFISWCKQMHAVKKSKNNNKAVRKTYKIPSDRSDYIKITDGETILEFKPVSYEFDFNNESDGGFDNNWVNVHCILTYESNIFSEIEPTWSVADMHEVNDIKETKEGIAKVVSGELQEYHARFFDPCFFNLLFVSNKDNYLIITEYHLYEPKANRMKWIKFTATVSKEELVAFNAQLEKFDLLFPCRKN